MLSFGQDIVKKLLEDNDIFRGNGDFYENYFDLKNSGVNDRLDNYLYIRYANFDIGKHRPTKPPKYGIMEVNTPYRAVFQLNKKIDLGFALSSLMSQIVACNPECVTVTAFSDSTKGIYYSEYNDDKIPINHNLVSIDFSFYSTISLQNCGCLTMESCNL